MSDKVTIQFADDTTGKNADVAILPNGHAHQLSKLLAETPLAADGYVTSVQLLQNRAGVTAQVKDEGKVIATASGDGDNYEKFDRTALGELSIIATKN
jgi:hypothetical protein